MLNILKKVWNIALNVGRILFRASIIAVVILNMLMIINIADFITDLDTKTDTMIEAINNYRHSDLPQFENLVKANVIIANVTKGCAGSGTHIKINEKVYILSCAHLDDPTDTFFVKERDEYRPIKLIKVNHAVDLALFEYIGSYPDLVAVSVATREPRVGDRIWAVGNPAMLEDAITSGTLVRKMGFEYLIDAKIYYGSSGGGLFNTKGEVIGVNVKMIANPIYALGISVNLSTIKDFLAGKIHNEVE